MSAGNHSVCRQLLARVVVNIEPTIVSRVVVKNRTTGPSADACVCHVCTYICESAHHAVCSVDDCSGDRSRVARGSWPSTQLDVMHINESSSTDLHVDLRTVMFARRMIMCASGLSTHGIHTCVCHLSCTDTTTHYITYWQTTTN